MNAPAFATSCGASLARCTFTGASVPLCTAHVFSTASSARRPARLPTRMVGDAPSSDADSKEAGATGEWSSREEAPLVEDALPGAGEEVNAGLTADLKAGLDVEMGGDMTTDMGAGPVALAEEVDLSDVEPCAPPQDVLNAQAIAEARAKFKVHDADSGSPEFQIATLSTRIAYLTDHLKKNPKDYSSTRGLLKMVSTRRKLLKYLKRMDVTRFNNIISGLNIRVSQQLREL